MNRYNVYTSIFQLYVHTIHFGFFIWKFVKYLFSQNCTCRYWFWSLLHLPWLYGRGYQGVWLEMYPLCPLYTLLSMLLLWKASPRSSICSFRYCQFKVRHCHCPILCILHNICHYFCSPCTCNRVHILVL